MSQNLQDVKSQIWEMANKLRGTMHASQFQNYILPFIFYRFLSEKQEAYLLEHELVELQDGETVNDAYVRQAEADGVADYIEAISASLGYAIEPAHTWETMLNKINQNEIIPSDYFDMFERFDKNCSQTELGSKNFKGVFDDVNLSDSRLGEGVNKRAKSLSDIVRLVSVIEYKREDGKDVLGEIYEYLIGEFAASAGQKGGEFFTPHGPSTILSRLVTHGVEPGDTPFTVYDPTMGSGSLLLNVRNHLKDGKVRGAVKFHGQELNTTSYHLARMNLMMHGVEYMNMSLRNGDTLESDWPDGVNATGVDSPRSFDAVVANPPYSAHWDNSETKLKDPRFAEYGKLAPRTKADYAFLLHSLYHLNNEGRMAIVLPHGVLFRGAAEGAIRKALIEKGYLEAVIGLPEKLFYGTQIPTTILVFSKNRTTKDVFFIDASAEFEKGKNQNQLAEAHIDKIIETWANRADVPKYAHLASIEEIRENDYNLNIPRYVDTFEEEEPVDLVAVLKEMKALKEETATAEASLFAQMKELGIDIDTI